MVKKLRKRAKAIAEAKKAAPAPVAKPKAPKERVLIFSSRGIKSDHRDLMDNLRCMFFALVFVCFIIPQPCSHTARRILNLIARIEQMFVTRWVFYQLHHFVTSALCYILIYSLFFLCPWLTFFRFVKWRIATSASSLKAARWKIFTFGAPMPLKDPLQKCSFKAVSMANVHSCLCLPLITL